MRRFLTGLFVVLGWLILAAGIVTFATIVSLVVAGL